MGPAVVLLERIDSADQLHLQYEETKALKSVFVLFLCLFHGLLSSLWGSSAKILKTNRERFEIELLTAPAKRFWTTLLTNVPEHALDGNIRDILPNL